MPRISAIILALVAMALGAEAFAPRPAVMPRSGVAPLKYSETSDGEATSVVSLAALSRGKLSKAEVDIFVAQVNADTEAIAKARAVKAMKPAPPKRAANPLFKKRGKTTAMKSSSAPRAARPTPPKREKTVRLKPVAKKTTSVAKTTPVAKKAPVAKRRPVAKKAPRAKPVYTKGMSLSEKIDAWQKAKFE